MSTSDAIRVEVTYAHTERQDVIPLTLPIGATLQQAIEASGLLAKYPEIDLAKSKLGIYSKLARLDTALRDLDRVEIYR
ncbi:MAG: RnfH family protein, partial [Rhodocyclaceae bacterium]|nr:RnfH family protein [Rhodocyclaceae bacterium]